MSMATFVGITCPRCDLTSTFRIEALLVSVAVDDAARDSVGPWGVADPGPGLDDAAATAAWVCDSCSDLVTLPLDWPALLTLVTLGVIVLDDAADQCR